MISCLAVAAQNIDQLVGNHVLDSLTSRLQVLARVEVIRMLSEVLADRSGDSQTNIGVDIDLADGQLCSVTQLFLRNADCIRHLAAELVDLVNKLTRYGRGTVQYNREARQTLGNFLEYIETQRRRNQNAVSIAGALLRSELVSAVRGADCDSQRVTAGAGYELLNLFRMSVGGILSGNLNVILYASQGAELSLDNNAVSVSVLYNLLGPSTFSSNGREEQSIITEEKPPSMQALQVSKSGPWSRCRAIGMSGHS